LVLDIGSSSKSTSDVETDNIEDFNEHFYRSAVELRRSHPWLELPEILHPCGLKLGLGLARLDELFPVEVGS